MKTWLRDHLIAIGAVTEHGTTRRARVRTCPRCRASILVGLTDPQVCAIEAAVDPDPLNQLGETLALLDGRYTVTARAEAGRYVLDDRGALAITGAPAGTRAREDVMAEHRCGRPTPAAGHAPSSFTTTTIRRLPPGSPAPFLRRPVTNPHHRPTTVGVARTQGGLCAACHRDTGQAPEETP